MALHKGKLLAGALFAGALFGAQEQTQQPERVVGSVGGGGFGRATRSYVLTPKEAKPEIVVKVDYEQDDEEVVLMLLVELIAKGVIA